MILTAEDSTIKINREELSVKYDGENVIFKGEYLAVSETIGRLAASVVVEAKSGDVNGAPVSVIFDWSISIANGEVVVASEDGSTMMID